MRTIIKELSGLLSLLAFIGSLVVIILSFIYPMGLNETLIIVIVLRVVSRILSEIAESESKLGDEVDKITFTFIKKVNWDIVLSVLLVVGVIAAVINGIIKSV